MAKPNNSRCDATATLPVISNDLPPADRTAVYPVIYSQEPHHSSGGKAHERFDVLKSVERTLRLPALRPKRTLSELQRESSLDLDLAIPPGDATKQMPLAVMTEGRLPTIKPTAKQLAVKVTPAVHWLNAELPLLLGLMVIGLVMHSFNMFNYPALNRFDDEGIYVSQAWAVLRHGQLSPYTYFYDHAPAGWLFLAGWLGLSGGPLTFGSAIDSGRMFIMLLHLAMIPLLYQVARKLGCGMAMAAFATLLFSVSPLAILYQRLVLLDNIMMFWILLSLNFLLDGRGRLSRVILSGMCFGVAALTKETVVFLTPAMLFLVWQQRWKHQGRFGLLGWILPALAVISLYPLYALFKSELLPAGYSLGFFIFNLETPPDKVSLVDVLKWQASRGGDGVFWHLVNTEWLRRDAILFAGGAIASAINLLRIVRGNRSAFATGLLGLLPLYYLARGGLVFDFYIIFAIPFLALNLAVLLQPLFLRISAKLGLGLVAIATVSLLGVYLGSGLLQPLFLERPDIASREAVSWIKQNLPPDSLIVTRNDMWTDLHEPGLGGPAFPNAHSHWKVALDPAIRDGVFKNDWHNVDYIIMAPALRQDLIDTNATLVLEALKNATPIKHWESDGNIIEVWKVNNQKKTTTQPETAKLPLSNTIVGWGQS